MKKNIELSHVRSAALVLSRATEKERNQFLSFLSEEISASTEAILRANRADVANARKAGSDSAFLQRLEIDESGIESIIKKLSALKRLKSGLGEVLEKRTDARGLTLTKVRVPLGVLAVIYEARPEVTIDVAALCVKSGNAVILKGGSEALLTNAVLFEAVRAALQRAKLPRTAVQFVSTGDREATYALLKRHDCIDLVIARGSYGMVKSVIERTSIPVLAHAAGGARVYVDKSANLDAAIKVLINAKVTKPAACNSLDTILVDRAIARTFIPVIRERMKSLGVQVLSRTNWDTETLGMTVGVKIVGGVDEAITFINAHTKKHSEGILAKNKKVIRKFVQSIDAAALFINASTRLHDGYEFGLGSEMGISTAKLHARGPVGLRELTTYTWHIYGKNTVR